jgi:hypothetical protein
MRVAWRRAFPRSPRNGFRPMFSKEASNLKIEKIIFESKSGLNEGLVG